MMYKLLRPSHLSFKV